MVSFSGATALKAALWSHLHSCCHADSPTSSALLTHRRCETSSSNSWKTLGYPGKVGRWAEYRPAQTLAAIPTAQHCSQAKGSTQPLHWFSLQRSQTMNNFRYSGAQAENTGVSGGRVDSLSSSRYFKKLQQPLLPTGSTMSTHWPRPKILKSLDRLIPQYWNSSRHTLS